MGEPHGERTGPSWVRAIAYSVAIAFVAAVLLGYVPNLIVTQLTRLVHSARVALAVAWFFVALAGLVAGLRWLQGKRVL